MTEEITSVVADGTDMSEGASATTVETPQSEAQSTPETGQQTHSSGTEVPAYTPNYEYTAFGNKHEIPEMFRSLIKDADTEKSIKEIFEKSTGVEVYKQKYDEIGGKYKETETNLNGLVSEIQQLGEARKLKDFNKMLSMLQIPKEDIVNWIVSELEYQEMPPEQRQTVDRQREIEMQRYALEKQNSELQSRYAQTLGQMKATGLESVLARPDIKPIVESFDARATTNGTKRFWDVVCEYGEAVEKIRNIDLTPEQAVQEVIKQFGLSNASQAQPPQTAPQVQNANKPPVIPNVGGKGAAPVKSAITSVDDLRKKLASLQGS